MYKWPEHCLRKLDRDTETLLKTNSHFHMQIWIRESPALIKSESRAGQRIRLSGGPDFGSIIRRDLHDEGKKSS